MENVTITVDASKSKGELRRIWRSIGYDEINWTYTQIGKDIYRQFKQLCDGPYWVRNHNAFTSGNLISAPAWGSTNCYTEDSGGKPHYDFSVNDRVYDTFLEGNCKPMIELAFMPHDLSAHPGTGPKESWRYPPKDYDKWRDLVSEFAAHLIDRYGKAEVRTWYFSTWNEADIGYFKWKPDEDLTQEDQRKARDQEYFKVHDYSCDGIWRVDDQLQVGGPDLAAREQFLDVFLNHVENEPNYVTGKKQSRLDFISAHVKGTAITPDKTVPNPDFDDVARRRWLRYAEKIKKYPRLAALPIIGNEWDIDVGTVLGIYDSKDFQFRNTSYYPVFVIRSVKEILDLMASENLNIELIMQWAFYFHGKRCFEGHRALFDPLGIRKPVFNGFELLSRMGAERISAETNDTEVDIDPGEVVGNAHRRPKDEADAEELNEFDRVEPHPQVDALASKNPDGSLQVLVWNQVCDQYRRGERRINVTVRGLAGWTAADVTEYRIDEDHSNAHTVWDRLGRPDWPTEEQIAAIKRREGLETARPDRSMTVEDDAFELSITLPMHGVSMFVIREHTG